MSNDTTREATIDGLRAMAFALEANPDVELPNGLVWHRVESKERMAALVKAYGGRFEKTHLGETFVLRKHMGSLRLDIDADRKDVCTAKIVGTQTVTKYVPTTEIEYESVEVEEDIVEWSCPESILAAAK